MSHVTEGNLPAIGFISLGQGPRADLDQLHRRVMRQIGCEARIVWRHALDGLSPEEVGDLVARDGEPAIFSNIRGATGGLGPLGDGWTSRWLGRDRLIPFVQAAIDDLERNEGVSVTIACAAEEFPAASFQSQRPMIMPAGALAAYAQALAVTKPKATIGLLVYGDRQREQQTQAWTLKPWSGQMTFAFSGNGRDFDAAVADLKPQAPDLVLVWAYGAGVADDGGLAQLSSRLGAPVILPAAAALGLAANLLLPVDLPVKGGQA